MRAFIPFALVALVTEFMVEMGSSVVFINFVVSSNSRLPVLERRGGSRENNRVLLDKDSTNH